MRKRVRTTINERMTMTTGSELTVRNYLKSENVKKRFQDILGEKAGQFISSIVSAVSLNQTLQECAPESVVAAAAIAASLDLPINPSLGMAHIVPYKERGAPKPKAQFQIGWKGFIQLAIRSGHYKHIHISEIREGDIQSINRITGEAVFNKDQITTSATNRPIVGYALYFLLHSGYEKLFYMSKEQCEEHGRRYSKSFETGNWKKDFDGMGRKTVVKMGLSKYGILSVDMNRAISFDQAEVNSEGEVVDYPDNPVQEPPQLEDKVETKATQSPRQVYETLKLQLQSAGKEELARDIIREHSAISNHSEKEFDEHDIALLIRELEKGLNG